MELAVPILIALALVAVAWRFLKGTAKTIALLVIAGLAALYVFGGLA